MKNLVTVNPIVWENGPELTIIGDVFDRLENGSPRQWVYQIRNTSVDKNDEYWETRYMPKRYLRSPNETGLGSEVAAKDACFEHKKELIEKLLSVNTDGGKQKAISDMCFISEIINDLKYRDVWNPASIKSSTLLRDWRKELMAEAGVEDESEIRSIHAELCGAENWGPYEGFDSFEAGLDLEEEE